VLNKNICKIMNDFTNKEQIGIKLFKMNKKPYFQSNDGKKIVSKLKRLLATAQTKNELESLKRFVYEINKMNNYEDLSIMVNTLNESFNIQRKKVTPYTKMELRALDVGRQVNYELDSLRQNKEDYERKMGNVGNVNKNRFLRYIKELEEDIQRLEKIKNSKNNSLIEKESIKIIKIRLLDKINIIHNRVRDKSIIQILLSKLGKSKTLDEYENVENLVNQVLKGNNNESIRNIINSYYKNELPPIEEIPEL